jgi:hypothetical protein
MDGGIMGTTYKYNIVQTNFLASDLLDFGITNGNAIKGMKLKIASGRSPSQNYENFRVAYKYISPSEEWTREETNIDPSTGATLTAEAFFHAMRQVYFRDNIDKSTVQSGTWYDIEFDIPLEPWDGEKKSYNRIFP